MPSFAPVYLSLRRQRLTERPQDFGAAPTDRWPRVWTGLYELGYETGVGTFMAHSDGSLSLYLSGGGGVIGMQSNAEIAEAGAAFLDALERDLDLLYEVESVPAPGCDGLSVFRYDVRWAADRDHRPDR